METSLPVLNHFCDSIMETALPIFNHFCPCPQGIYERLLINAGVTILRGKAKFVDEHTVDVEGKTYTAKYINIAVGGWPYVPDIP